MELLTELAAGAIFAFGLVYTGMVRPTKVRGGRVLHTQPGSLSGGSATLLNRVVNVHLLASKPIASPQTGGNCMLCCLQHSCSVSRHATECQTQLLAVRRAQALLHVCC